MVTVSTSSGCERKIGVRRCSAARALRTDDSRGWSEHLRLKLKHTYLGQPALFGSRIGGRHTYGAVDIYMTAVREREKSGLQSAFFSLGGRSELDVA